MTGLTPRAGVAAAQPDDEPEPHVIKITTRPKPTPSPLPDGTSPDLQELYALLMELMDILLIVRGKKAYGRPYKHLGKSFDMTSGNKKRCLAMTLALFIVAEIGWSLWQNHTGARPLLTPQVLKSPDNYGQKQKTQNQSDW